jgi:RNA polymerase sigma-70 factor (ECF subfamily)
MNRAICIAVIIVGISCAFQNASGQNLVKNPGAEQGRDSPADWSQGAAVKGVEYIWDRKFGFNSNASLCLNKTDQRFFPVAQWFQVIDRTGESPQLEVSARVKAEQVTKAVLDVQFLGGKGNSSHQWAACIGGQKDGEPSANHDWKIYSGRVVIPKNIKKIQIGLQIYGPGKIWFDDVTAIYVK